MNIVPHNAFFRIYIYVRTSKFPVHLYLKKNFSVCLPYIAHGHNVPALLQKL